MIHWIYSGLCLIPETDVSRALERVLNCKGYSMKKLMLLSACLLAVPALHAEQMQFVTTMSAPVGNFAHLDAADSTHVTCVGKKDGDSCIGGYLNFCNTRSNVGNIVIKGANAYLKQVNVQNGATLGSTNTPEYRLSDKLTVENGGTVTAGRVMASNVTFKDTNFHKSNVTGTLYGSDIAAMGGKADNMSIASTAKINKSAQTAANLGQEMEWSNQYSKDYDSSGTAKSNGKTYTSFLLKSKGTGEEQCTPTQSGQERYTETCSDGSTKITYTWNYSTCKYDASGYCPKEGDDISCCVLQKHIYHYLWTNSPYSDPNTGCGGLTDYSTEIETYYTAAGTKNNFEGERWKASCPANAEIGTHLRGENIGWSCRISATERSVSSVAAGCSEGIIEKLICQWDKNTDNTCTKNQITDLVISEP